MADISTGLLNQYNQYQAYDSLGLVDRGSIDPTDVVQAEVTKLRSIKGFTYLDEPPKYYIKLNVGSYTRVDLNTIGDTTTELAINLPLPHDLVDTQYVTYDETPLNPVLGNAVNSGLQFLNNKGENAIKRVTDAIWGQIGISSELIDSVIGATAGAAVGSSNLISRLAGVAGYSPNQFITILLRGPQYKRFGFEWDFVPRSPSEATKLNVILTYLKNAQAPGYVQGGGFFRFPKIFRLGFHPNSGYMYKFKPAVLFKLSVNYAGGGAPVFNRSFTQIASPGGPNDYPDNPPAIYKVQMWFQELEFWLRGNYNSNNNPDDVHFREETPISLLREQALSLLKSAVLQLPNGQAVWNQIEATINGITTSGNITGGQASGTAGL